MVTLGITNKCNNNCLICVYDTNKMFNLKNFSIKTQLTKLSDLKKGETICLSGGEPLLSEDFFKILEDVLTTGREVSLLTNGRVFYYKNIAKKLSRIKSSNFRVGVPLHGSNSVIHNKITRTQGSFIQTIQGVKNLLANKINTDIRIVLNKYNIFDIYNLTNLIIKEFCGINNIIFIFPLIRGNAAKNSWIIPKYDDVFINIEKALDNLIINNIKFKLYHFPFCKVKPYYWDYVYNSLENYETEKTPNCKKCYYEKFCKGVPKEYLNFFGTSEFKPLPKSVEIKKTGNKYNPITIKNKVKSQFIKSYYDPKYGRFSASLPDIIAVKHNIKPLARLSCNFISEFYFIKDVLFKEGIFCKSSNKKILSGKHLNLNYNDPNNGLADVQSEEFGTIYIYISKSKKLLEKIKNNDPEISCRPSIRSIKLFAESLGYPTCCINYCLKNYNYSISRFFKNKISIKNKYFYLNNFLRYFSNYYLSFHTPCSYNCKKSLEYNKSIFEALRKEYPDFSESLRYNLKLPFFVWFGENLKLMDGIDHNQGIIFDGSFSNNQIKYSAVHIFNSDPNKRNNLLDNDKVFKFIKGNNIKLFKDRLYIYLDSTLVYQINKKQDSFSFLFFKNNN